MRLKSIFLSACVLLAGGKAFSQLTVTTAGQKYPLLEEGTGTWCGYCPDGSQRLQQTVEPNYPRAIAVAFHNGDVMTLSGDPFNTDFINSWPGATIDRKLWTHGSTTSMNVNRGYWNTDVGVQNALAPNFDLSATVSYDTGTRVATIRIAATTLTAANLGEYRLNAYIVEDSVSASTGSYRQHSYMYGTSGSWFYNQCTASCGSSCTSCANLPDSVYAHMNTVRKVLATGGSIYGDLAFTSPSIGDTNSVTYSYTVPTSSRARFIKVVGLIAHYDATVTTNRNIENAIRAELPLPCAPVTAANVTITPGITTATVKFPYTINYNFAGAKGYRYTVTTTSATPSVLGTFTNTPTVTLTGLTPLTTYYVWMRDSCDGALTGWTSKSFTTKSLNVAQAYAEDFSVSAFPSPVQNTLNVAIDGAMGSEAKIQVLDLSGRVITTVDVNATKLELNMQELAAGMYLLKYNDSIHSQTIKITKE